MHIPDIRTFVHHVCTHVEPLWILRLQQDDWVKRHRPSKMSLSEILVVILYFEHSPFKCFKHYYHWLQQEKQTDFPNLLSYSRFIQIKPRAIVPLFAVFLHTKGKCSGISYIDATFLKVCHNRRITTIYVYMDWSNKIILFPVLLISLFAHHI